MVGTAFRVTLPDIDIPKLVAYIEAMGGEDTVVFETENEALRYTNGLLSIAEAHRQLHVVLRPPYVTLSLKRRGTK